MPESTQNTDELNISEAEQTTSFVDAASQDVKEAASTAPNVSIADALKGVSDVLQDIKKELANLSVQQAEQQTEQLTPEKPDVSVNKPEEETRYRHVRRFGRKVKRAVKA